MKMGLQIKTKYKVVALAMFGVLLIYYFAIRRPGKIQYQDSNANGIWDDVEPYIERTAKTETQRKALEYRFREFQNVLLNPEIGTQVKEGEVLNNRGRASACLKKIWGGFEKAPDPDEIKEVILNSRARVEAWIRYNSNLSGGFYSLWNEERNGNPCPFQ